VIQIELFPIYQGFEAIGNISQEDEVFLIFVSVS